MVGVILSLLPWLSLLAILTAIPAWKAYQGAYQNADNIPALIPSMGLNVLVNLAAPVFLERTSSLAPGTTGHWRQRALRSARQA